MDELVKLQWTTSIPPSSRSQSTYSASLSPITGFHTISTIVINNTEQSPPHQHLHILYLLPSSVFVDRYELEQKHHDGDLPPFDVWGETNLELPLQAVQKGGSALLLTLGTIGPVKEFEVVEVPLHMRYTIPEKSFGLRSINVGIYWPTVFWSTHAGEVSSLFSCRNIHRLRLSVLWRVPNWWKHCGIAVERTRHSHSYDQRQTRRTITWGFQLGT